MLVKSEYLRENIHRIKFVVYGANNLINYNENFYFLFVLLGLSFNVFYQILFSLPFQGIHYRTSEESSIRFVQPKNYGSISGDDIADNLTYTWSCVDAFGAVDQNGSGFRNITHKIKRLIHSDRNIPKPRKQLLKNG